MFLTLLVAIWDKLMRNGLYWSDPLLPKYTNILPEWMPTSAIVVFLPMGSEFSITTGEPVSVLYLQDHWENNMF